ncbi:hypothetical protein [Leptospira meyeri]|uniref:hypothetical protein n=1 Tax=Leptospira meyeri TaxID=29508 RepID=UPI001084044F|nr:hypothetical protein [Leptospira meyeri]TGL14503.1 hypothetical protein EHQ50_07340 [Leptospira meyeri]
MKKIIFSLILLSIGCEPGISISIAKDSVLGRECPDSDRIYTLYRKQETHTENYNGKIIFENGKINIERDGIIDQALMIDDNYIVIFGAALGSSFESYRLAVSCPSTNKIVFDSFDVTEKDGLCMMMDGGSVKYNFFLEPKEKAKFDCR